MRIEALSLEESGALPWIAAALISAFAHALVAGLILRSPAARTLSAAPVAATEVELADWPATVLASAGPTLPAATPSATPAPSLTRMRSHPLRTFRAAAPELPMTAPTVAPSRALLPWSNAAAGKPTPPASAAQAAPTPLPGRPIIVNSPDALSALQLWEAAMNEQLERYKRYPEEARRLHQEDTVSMRITVDRSGKVLRVSIVNSHGYALLDQEALQMVQQAAPLPPLPAVLSGDRLNVIVPVEFFLLQASPLSGAPLQ